MRSAPTGLLVSAVLAACATGAPTGKGSSPAPPLGDASTLDGSAPPSPDAGTDSAISPREPEPNGWQPPVGIPRPTFGVAEVAPDAPEPWEEDAPGYYYVDNTHARATDDGNPLGSPDRPRATMPTDLPGGAVVFVDGGTDTEPYVGDVELVSRGTSVAPVFIVPARGARRPVLRGMDLDLTGSYLVLEGFELDNSRIRTPNADHLALRDLDIHGRPPGGNTSMIGTTENGTFIVILGNHIHDNGDVRSATESDINGVGIGTADDGRPSHHVWIVDNHIHHHSGDSMRFGGTSADAPATTLPHHIYVGRNLLHDNRENAIDVKNSQDVVVSENVAHGFRATDSSGGVAITIHYGAARLWLLFNEIYDSEQGIKSSGATGLYAVGNVIYDIEEGEANGLHAYSTHDVAFVNNTLADCGTGIRTGNGVHGLRIVNNLVVGAPDPIHVTNTDNQDAAFVHHNLVPRRTEGVDADRVVPDPLLVDPASLDFRPRAGSPALDAGAEDAVYRAFRDLYEPDFRALASPLETLDIARDFDGNPRPTDADGDGDVRFDIGAFEGIGATAELY